MTLSLLFFLARAPSTKWRRATSWWQPVKSPRRTKSSWPNGRAPCPTLCKVAHSCHTGKRAEPTEARVTTDPWPLTPAPLVSRSRNEPLSQQPHLRLQPGHAAVPGGASQVLRDGESWPLTFHPHTHTHTQVTWSELISCFSPRQIAEKLRQAHSQFTTMWRRRPPPSHRQATNTASATPSSDPRPPAPPPPGHPLLVKSTLLYPAILRITLPTSRFPACLAAFQSANSPSPLTSRASQINVMQSQFVALNCANMPFCTTGGIILALFVCLFVCHLSSS